MGNCCGGGESSAVERNAFTGEGRRLGTTNEPYQDANGRTPPTRPSQAPEPVPVSNLTEEEREKQRAERVAAAEARLKKQGIAKPKKKKDLKDAPLVGPNSKPLMTWTAG